MKTAHMKKPRLALLGLGICYLLVLSGLLLLLHSRRPLRPKVEMLETNYAADIFEVRGKNLSPDTRLTLIRDDERSSAVVTTKFMWGQVLDIKVAPQADEKMGPGRAWALCRNIGLVALDIHNPEQPEIIHTIHIEKYLWKLEIQGDKAYIACGKEGVVICDISSVTEARVVRNFTLPHPVTDISVGPDVLYVSNGKNGISIIDPNSGEGIGHLDLPGNTLRLAYRDAKLFALGRHAGKGFLRIYDVSQGAPPQLRAALEFDGFPRDYLFWDEPMDGAKNDTIYLANGDGGVGIVKIAPEGSATFKGSIHPSFRSSSLARYGDKIGVFGRAGSITTYTRETDGTFEPGASLHAGSQIFGAAISGDYALTAASEKGIAIVDLRAGKNHGAEHKATLSSLHSSATWKVTEHGVAVRHAKKIQFFKDLSIAGTSATTLDLTGVIRLPSSEFSNAYAVTDSMADSAADAWIYAVVKGSGLHIVRVGADGTLEQSGIIALPTDEKTRMNACVTHANKLYLCSTDGLLVYDISSPEDPLYLTTKHMAQSITNITFGEQHAYISSVNAGVQICPITPENTLGAATTIELPEHLISGRKSLDTTLTAGILYIASGYRGILSVDVRDPQRPLILDSIELKGFCTKVKSVDGLLVTRTSDAVYLLDTRSSKHMGMLCRLGDMQDFHIDTKNNELLQLYTTGITSIPLPLSLEPASATPTRLEFHLPVHLQPGRYNLFLNLNGIHSEPVGSITWPPNRAQHPDYTFIPTRSK